MTHYQEVVCSNPGTGDKLDLTHLNVVNIELFEEAESNENDLKLGDS